MHSLAYVRKGTEVQRPPLESWLHTPLPPLPLAFPFPSVLDGMYSSKIQVGPVDPAVSPKEESLGGDALPLPPVPRESAQTPVVPAEDAEHVLPALASRPVETPPVGLPEMLLGHDPQAGRATLPWLGTSARFGASRTA